MKNIIHSILRQHRLNQACICAMMLFSLSCKKTHDASVSFAEVTVNGQRFVCPLNQSMLTQHYSGSMGQASVFEGLTYRFSFVKGDTTFTCFMIQDDGSKEIRMGKYEDGNQDYSCSFIMTSPSFANPGEQFYSRTSQVVTESYDQANKRISLSFDASIPINVTERLALSGSLRNVPVAKNKEIRPKQGPF